MTNDSASALILSDIEFSFPGSRVAKRSMQGVKIAVSSSDDPDADDGRMAAGTTATWSNGVVDLDTGDDGENKVRNEVHLEAPAPPRLKISVHSWVENAQRRWAGISGAGAKHFRVSGDWDHFRRCVQRYFDDDGERAGCIEQLVDEA